MCKVRSRALILHEGALLVVKHRATDTYHALPGGHVDPGEDPAECMIRELTEELGIAPELGPLQYVYTFTDAAGQQSIEFLFLITNSEAYRNHEEQMKSHAHEIVDVRWVLPTDELRVLPEEIFAAFKVGTLVSDQVRFVKG